MEQQFSRMLLKDSRLSAFRQLIDSETSVKRDVIDSWSTGVHLDYRGYGLSLISRYCLYREVYLQGYKVITAQCLSPITHKTAEQSGWIPLLECSISYLQYERDGVRPLECIQFKSNYEGADSSALCVFNHIFELIKASSKSLLEKDRLPKLSP